jgi:hypothetical protein
MIGVAIRAEGTGSVASRTALRCRVIRRFLAVARALPRIYKSAGNDEVVLVFGWLCVTRLHGLSRTTNRWSWPIAVNRETQADLTDAHHPRIRGASWTNEADAGEGAWGTRVRFRLSSTGRRWLGRWQSIGAWNKPRKGPSGEILAFVLTSIFATRTRHARPANSTPRTFLEKYIRIVLRKASCVYRTRNGRQPRGVHWERLQPVALAAN